MIKLTKEQHGANIIVGIRGDSKEEIEMEFNGVYNCGGCPSIAELEWIDDKFAVFQTGEKRLFNSFIIQNFVRLSYPKAVASNKEIERMAKISAKQKFLMIEEDSRLLKTNTAHYNL